jgi:hypothetical protein
MPRRPRAMRFFRDGLPGEDQRVQLRRHLPPARKALAGLPVAIPIKPMRIAGLVAFKEALCFGLRIEIIAIPVACVGLGRSRGAVPPLPRRNRIGLRPQTAASVSGLPLQASVFGLVRGILLVVPSNPSLDEQRPEVPTADFNPGHGTAISPDVLNGDSHVLSSDYAPSGPRGGPAIGLGGFGRVDPVETDRHLSANRTANSKSVPVGDLYDAARERLPGFYGRISLGLPVGAIGTCDEKRGQERGS